MKIVKSLSTDPETNLALEQELLSRQDDDFLLLYINSPCVVVGRNQNPAAEADLEYCRRHEIPVLRRSSGGGAVYHDFGNINWAFVTAAGETPPLDDNPHAPVIAALNSMGVEAVAGGRGELTVAGKKISGTASCVTKHRRLFHGTLLFDADRKAMDKALAGNPALRGRKVASVPSETVNLKTLLPEVGSAGMLVDMLADFFAGISSERLIL